MCYSVFRLHGLFCSFCIVPFRGEQPGQGSNSRTVAALKGEAEEGGPDEGAAASEGGPHVQRHQGKVHKLGEAGILTALCESITG